MPPSRLLRKARPGAFKDDEEAQEPKLGSTMAHLTPVRGPHRPQSRA